MPFTVTLPKLSPTMEEGAIAKWHIKEGDHVESDQLLLEVSTDKATVEYNALDGGWLKKILVKEGETARVNQPIAIFTEKKEESIESYKPEGLEVEAPKEVEKTKSSKKQEQAPQVQPVSRAVSSFGPEKPMEDYRFPFPSEQPKERVAASPLARKLAKEKGLDLGSIRGSGPNERVMSRDLNLAQGDQLVSFTNRELPQIPPGSYQEESMSQMRKSIAQRLQEAKISIPHFYVAVEVNAEPLVELREQMKAGGIKLTYNDFVIRACALVLRHHPEVNSGYNSLANTIIRFKTIDISIAVTLPEGLITPIIRHADYKNVGEISSEVKYLSGRAKEGKLKPEEFRGGSFTVSNLGMYGVSDFQAVINPPQGAILAVGGVLDVPVVKNGQVVPGKVMKLHLSADHRVIDGVAASQFLKSVQKVLENPALLVV